MNSSSIAALVPRRARTRSRAAPAHRRCEAAPAARAVRTPAVADTDALRMDRARGAHRIVGVRHRRRTAARRIPAHRARVADAAPADRALAIRRSRALVAAAVPRRRRRHGRRGDRSLPARRPKARIQRARSSRPFSNAPRGAGAAALAARLRQALATLAGDRRTPAEWAPRLLAALRQLGWHGARALRSDEQQTVNRWHALLDEYSALGPWLGRATAHERWRRWRISRASATSMRPASRRRSRSPNRTTIRWCATTASGWPGSMPRSGRRAPRPDVFIPLRLQVAAGVPWASAAAQTRAAQAIARRLARRAPTG